MRIAVLAKAIPSPTDIPELSAEFRLQRDVNELVLDPGDEYGIELALQLVKQHGGEVVYISMGPDGAIPALRKALSMGGDSAILVTDPALAGADTLVTAKALAAAIGSESFDLVIAAVESSDGGTGTFAATLAEILNLPAATFARKVEIESGVARVPRQTVTGGDVVELSLPALVTVTAGITEPRYPTFRGVIAAKQKPLTQKSLADLGADLAPSTQWVESTEAAPDRAQGEIIEDDGTSAARIADLLQEVGVI